MKVFRSIKIGSIYIFMLIRALFDTELLHAQSLESLNIRILDTLNSAPIPFAKINMVDKEDHVISTSLSDNTGTATFKITDLKTPTVRFITRPFGFKEFKSADIILSQNTVSEFMFFIAKDTITLSEVSISEKKIKRDGEKLIYSINQDQFSTGTAVLEILSKLPGINTEQAQIKLNGKAVLILIDGKGEFKSQSDQLKRLSELSADQVDNIELISNPSSKYDASIRAVINIVTKRTKGYSTLRSSYSQPFFKDKQDLGLNYISGYTSGNLDFRLGAVKTSVFLGIYNTTGMEKNSELRTVENGISYFSRNSSKNSNFFLLPSLVMNYDINKRSSININADISLSPSYLKDTYYQYHFVNGNNPDSSSLQKNHFDNESYRYIFAGNYKYLLNESLGSYLYINGTYLYNSNNERNIINETNTPIRLLNNDLFGSSNIYSTSLIISDLLKKGYLSTEFGIKSNFLNSNTDQKLNNLNSRYFYKENINAVFFTTRWKFGKHQVIAGLRSEIVDYNTVFNAERLEGHYFKIYPNFLFQSDLTDDATLSFAYSKKIRRPHPNDLNPTQRVQNLYQKLAGNLNFQPVYYDRVESEFRFKNFGLTLYYDHSINQRIIYPTEDPYLFTTANIGKFNEVGFNLNHSFQFAKWFSSSNNVDWSRSSRGNDGLNYTHNTGTGYRISSSNDLTLSKKSRVQFNLAYNSRSYTPFSVFEDYISSSLSFKQLLFKDKLNLNINVTDPLGIQRLETFSQYAFQQQRNEQITNDRTLSIQLIYSFRFGDGFSNQKYLKDTNGEMRY